MWSWDKSQITVKVIIKIRNIFVTVGFHHYVHVKRTENTVCVFDWIYPGFKKPVIISAATFILFQYSNGLKKEKKSILSVELLC